MKRIIAGALCLAVGLCAAAPPNVVIFLVDDFGEGALSGFGSALHETPHIDKLAERGAVFTDAYAACTVCSPSRAAILTGKAPGRSRLTDWIPGHKKQNLRLSVPDWKMYMEHSVVTLAEALKEKGYATAFIGKWHLLPVNHPELMDQHFPQSHGFDINIGGREWGQPKGRGQFFYPWDMPNVEGGKPGDYLTDRLTDYAVEFIESEQQSPFFLYLSYYTVHVPLQAKPELVEKYAARLEPGQLNHEKAVYAAMVESLDESVGRVVDQLKKCGLLENTLIIFTGDNGPDYQEYTGGYRSYKAYAHDGGVHVPLFIAGPGIPAGKKVDVPVIGMDFYPTILDMIGAPLKPEQHVDGVSLKPLLTGEGPIPNRSLYWHYPHYHRTKPYGAVRNGDFKLIEFFEDGRLELYDLKKDPYETTNLAASMPEKADQLLHELKKWRAVVGAQMMTPNPDYETER